MTNSKIAGMIFSVDNYVDTSDFEKLIDKTVNNPSLIASIIGCVEGIIQPVKDKNYFTIMGMYKVECSGNYLFLSVYNFIKNNNKLFNYIARYFNLWHGREYEDISYDEYNKMDLSNNFNELTELLWEEGKLASDLNDKAAIEAYNIFCKCLSSLYCLRYE